MLLYNQQNNMFSLKTKYMLTAKIFRKYMKV